MRWPDAEGVVASYLATALSLRVVTGLPREFETQLPIVRVTRGPGSDDGITDEPLMDVEVFTSANDLAGLWTLAENARQAMHDLAGNVVSGALVDTVNTATGPTRISYENPAVERVVASYRLALRQYDPA